MPILLIGTMYRLILYTFAILLVFSWVQGERTLPNGDILSLIKDLQTDVRKLKDESRSQGRDIVVTQISLSALTEMIKTQNELIKEQIANNDRLRNQVLSELSTMKEKIAENTKVISTTKKSVSEMQNEMMNKEKKFIKEVVTIKENIADNAKNVKEVSKEMVENKEKFSKDVNVIRDNIVSNTQKELQDVQKLKETQNTLDKNVRDISANVIAMTKKIADGRETISSVRKETTEMKLKQTDIEQELVKTKEKISINNEKEAQLEQWTVKIASELKEIGGNVMKVKSEVNTVERQISNSKKEVDALKNEVKRYHHVEECSMHKHCIVFYSQCWCFVNKMQKQREACGYGEGYRGRYFSIISTGKPIDLIIALGKKPRRGCTNKKCDQDCATNQCYGEECCGSQMTCWSDEKRWNRNSSGIVRCTNYEQRKLSHV